jgi:hypothetical protein
VRPGTKYRNVRTEVDGISFASKREAKRFVELRLIQKAGVISDLKTQVRYPLDVNGQPVCHYIADFTYLEKGELVVEDSKGYRTPEFILKSKLMRAVHGIEVQET